MFYDLDPGFLGFSIGADFRLPGTVRTMIGSFRWLLSFKHPCPCALGTVTGPRSVWPCAYFLASGKAPPCRCQRNTFFRGGRLARSPAHYLRKRSAFGKNSNMQRRFQNMVSSGFLPPLIISTPTHAPNSSSGKISQPGRLGPLTVSPEDQPSELLCWHQNGVRLFCFQQQEHLQARGAFKKRGQGGVTFSAWLWLCSFLMNADQLCTNVARAHAEYSHEM